MNSGFSLCSNNLQQCVCELVMVTLRHWLMASALRSQRMCDNHSRRHAQKKLPKHVFGSGGNLPSLLSPTLRVEPPLANANARTNATTTSCPHLLARILQPIFLIARCGLNGYAALVTKTKLAGMRRNCKASKSKTCKGRLTQRHLRFCWQPKR